jgi:Periplasmic copper-binding protein (NosD)
MNMSKSFATLFVLIFLLASGVVAIQSVKAQSLTGIIIKSDGSVTPSGVAMQMEGNTYRITADLNISITVERGNIVLDGANHTLQGPGTNQNAIAITLRASNVTVENLHVNSWKAGVYGAFNNNTITRNVFMSNYQAIAIYADDYIVSGNNISVSSDGAILIDTGATRPQGDNNRIMQNQITNNNWALDILNSNGTTIMENSVTDNAVVLTLGTQSASVDNAGFQLLYSNNFINNAKILNVPIGGPFVSNVVPLSPAGQWDNGSVGNYWSDYRSKYPNATEIDNSGIGDTQYSIIDSTTYSDNYANGTDIQGTAILGIATDRYPVMVPFSTLIAPNPTSTASPSPSNPNKAPEPFPTLTVATFSVVAVVVVVAGSLIYFRKHKPNSK